MKWNNKSVRRNLRHACKEVLRRIMQQRPVEAKKANLRNLEK